MTSPTIRRSLASTGHLHGYARVSTDGQDHALQIDALAKAGCARTWIDRASGGTTSRPELDAMLDALLPGDTLVVWKLDRLGRSVSHVVELVRELGERKIDFISLTEGFDTSTPGGRMIMTIFAALAEMEREIVRERTHAGLAAARARGRVDGRPSVMTPEKLAAVRWLIGGGSTVVAAAAAVGVSRASVYRALRAEAT